MSEWVGVIRSATTGAVLAVVNPDDDSELDNPRWLLIRAAETDAIELIRVKRDAYMGAMSLDELAALVESLK